MKFENGGFNQNVEESEQAIESLDHAINELSDNKGLEDLGDQTEEVSIKFDALRIAVETAVYRIVNSVIDGVSIISRKLNEVTIDPIMQGYGKYEEKINAVQTIMNATGLTIDQVEEKLEKLSWFTDETSYKYSDMVSSLSKFTSAGVGLDDAVTDMIGIATWAGTAGVNAQEATSAYYNLSQAIGSGVIMNKDWVSIEGLNMGNVESMQTFIDVAKEFVTYGEEYSDLIDKYGANSTVFAETVKKNGHTMEEVMKYVDYFQSGVSPKDVAWEDFTTTGFRDTLAGKWFTSDIFNEAMRRYGDFSEQLKAFEDAGGYDTASEALRDYNDAFSGLIDTIYESYTEFGRNSEEFRKTLEDNGISLQTAMDFVSVKEARIFNEHLVELSETFKKTADEFGFESKEFAKAANEAGYSVEEAADIVTNGIEKYRKAEQSLGQKGFEASYEARTFSDAWGAAIEGVSSQWSRFWQNIIGNYEEAKDIWTKVSEVLWDVFAGPISDINDTIEAVINAGGRLNIIEGIKNVWTTLESVIEPIKEALADVFSFFQPDENGEYKNAAEYIYAITEAFRRWSETLGSFRGRFYEIKTIATTVFSVLKTVGEIVWSVITNIGRVIKAVLPDFGKIFTFISQLFSKMGGFEEIGDSVSNAITNFTNKIIFRILQVKVVLLVILAAIVEKVQDTIETIKVMYLLFMGDFEKAMETNSELVDKLQRNGTYKKILKLREVFDRAREAFTVFAENIQNKVIPIIDKIKEKIPEAIQKIISVIADVGSIGWFIFDIISSIVTSAAELFSVLILGSAEAAEGLSPLNTISAILQGLGPVVQAVITIIKNLLIGIGDFVRNINVWKAAGLLLINGIIDGSISISAVLEDLTFDIKNFFKGLGLGGFFDNIKDVLSGIWNVFENTFKNIVETNWLKATADLIRNFAWSLLILAGAALVLSTIDSRRLEFSFGVITGFIAEMVLAAQSLIQTVKAMNGLNAMSFFGPALSPLFSVTAALIGFAGAIFILSAAVLNLGKTFDKYGPTAFTAAISSLTVGMYGLVGAITGLIYAIRPMTKYSSSGKLAVEFLGLANLLGSFAVAFLLMSVAVKVIGSMKPEEAIQGVLAVGAMLAGIYEFVIMMQPVLVNTKSLLSLAAAFVIFAIGINALVIPVELLGHMKPEQVLQGLSSIGWLLLEFVGTIAIIKKIDFDSSSRKLIGMAASMVLFAVAIDLLTVPVILLGQMKLEQIFAGLIGIGVQLALLMAVVYNLSTDDISKNAVKMIGLASAFLILAVAIDLMSLAVIGLATIDFITMLEALMGIAVELGIIGAFCWAVNNIIGGTPAEMIKLSLGILSISAAIAVLTFSVISIAKLTQEQQINGIIGLFGIIVAVSAFLLAIKLIDPAGLEFLKLSVGLIALSVGIMLMTQALKMLGEIKLIDIGIGLVKLAVILAGIVVISSLLIGFYPQMITFGITVGVIGAGLYLLGIGIDAMHTAIKNIVDDPNVQAFAQDIIGGIQTALDSLQPLMEGMAQAWKEMWDEISKAWTDFWNLVNGQKEEANRPDNYEHLAGEKNPITGETVLPPEPTEDEVRKWNKNTREKTNYMGEQIDNGIAEGMVDGTDAINNANQYVSDTVVDGLADMFQIHSPSKVTYEQGKNVTLGFAEGIKDKGASKELKDSLKAESIALKNHHKDIDDIVDSSMEEVSKSMEDASGDIDIKQSLVDSLLGGIDDSKLLNDDQKKWIKEKVQGIVDGLNLDGIMGDTFNFDDIKQQIKGAFNFDGIEIPEVENPFDNLDLSGLDLSGVDLSGTDLDVNNLANSVAGLNTNIGDLNTNLANTDELSKSLNLSDIFGTSDLTTKAEAEGNAIGEGISTGITDATRKLSYNDIIHRNAIMRAAQKDGIWSEAFDKALKDAGYTNDFYSTADRLKIYNEARKTRVANFNDRINIKNSAELYRLLTTLNNHGIMSDEFENAMRSYYGDDYKQLTAKEKNDLVDALTEEYAKEEEFIANNYDAILRAYESGTGSASFKEFFNLKDSDDRDLADFIDRVKAYKNYQNKLQNESEQQTKDLDTMSNVINAFNQVIDTDGVKVTMATTKGDVLQNALKVIESSVQKDGVKKNSLEYVTALGQLNWSYEDAEEYLKAKAEEDKKKKTSETTTKAATSSTSETKANTTSTYNPVTTVKADNVTVDTKNTTATAQTSAQTAGDISTYIRDGVQKLTNIDAQITVMNTKIDQITTTMLAMNENALNELALLTGWKGEVGTANASIILGLSNIQNKGVPISNRSSFMTDVAEFTDTYMGNKSTRRVRGN